MSFYRATLVALATLFTVGMTSLASACCDWRYSAPIAYTAVTYPVAPVTYGGCGGYCGGCGTPTAAAVFAQPVAPAPIAVGYWGGTCPRGMALGVAASGAVGEAGAAGVAAAGAVAAAAVAAAVVMRRPMPSRLRSMSSTKARIMRART